MRYEISPASDCTSAVDGNPDPVEAGAAGTLGPETTMVWPPDESVAVSDPSNGEGISNSEAVGDDVIVSQLVTADNLLTRVVAPLKGYGGGHTSKSRTLVSQDVNTMAMELGSFVLYRATNSLQYHTE